MKSTDVEQVSEFLDGELDPTQAKLFIEQLNDSPVMQKKLDNYALTRGLIREPKVAHQDDLLAGIKQALQNEPSYLLSRKSKVPYAITALAASLALVAVLVFNTAPMDEADVKMAKTNEPIENKLDDDAKPLEPMIVYQPQVNPPIIQPRHKAALATFQR